MVHDCEARPKNGDGDDGTEKGDKARDELKRTVMSLPGVENKASEGEGRTSL